MKASVERLAADLESALGNPGQAISPADDGAPRLKLFHAANSICSQKVRVVLAQHQMAYTSHVMNIFAGQTYLPDYVRLRLIGCERSGVPLVACHTGSTSVSSGGCDPAVVPTLIDQQTSFVIVDSKRICLYVDSLVTEPRRLRPSFLEAAIDAELSIVDDLPNYQMLTGKPGDIDRRPQQLRKNDGVTFSMSKVKRCDQYLKEFERDEALVKAYGAKRQKELDAAEHLFSEEAMRAAYANVTAACALLDSKLKAGNSNWLMGDFVTMADLVWAVELLRMKNLGADHIWEQDRMPSVSRFVAAAERLASVQSSVLAWPGALF